jgi:hypothetical protein
MMKADSSLSIAETSQSASIATQASRPATPPPKAAYARP